MAKGGVIEAEHVLPLVSNATTQHSAIRAREGSFQDATRAMIQAAETRWIATALRNNSTVQAAAAALGIDVKTLYRKRVRYGLLPKKPTSS
jgi:DNA-binding NtrC family response regulator